jgi:hypothetical protein
MSARASSDPWVQTFGLLALVSGALTAYARVTPPPAALAAGRTGRKIVDARLARDADTSDLAAAAAAAAPGDTLYVRSGVYRGPIKLRGGMRLVGLGPPDSVVLEGDGTSPLIDVTAGAVSISSVSLRGGAPAIYAHAGARLSLAAVTITGADVGVVIMGEGSSGEFERLRVVRSARDGVFVRDGASVTLSRSELVGQIACGLLVSSASAFLRGSTLRLNDYGICSDSASKVDAGDSDLKGNLRGPTAKK